MEQSVADHRSIMEKSGRSVVESCEGYLLFGGVSSGSSLSSQALLLPRSSLDLKKPESIGR